MHSWCSGFCLQQWGVFTLWEVSPKTWHLVIPDLSLAKTAVPGLSLVSAPASEEWGCAVCENTGPASIWKLHPDSPYSHTRQALQVKNLNTTSSLFRPPPKNPKPVSRSFNRLWKSLSWNHGSKEQTKLNSRLYLTRCLSSCFAILYLVLRQILTAVLCCVCLWRDLSNFFSVPPAPGLFQHRWSIINGYPEVTFVNSNISWIFLFLPPLTHPFAPNSLQGFILFCLHFTPSCPQDWIHCSIFSMELLARWDGVLDSGCLWILLCLVTHF